MRDKQALQRVREFDTPDDLSDKTFLDALDDVFTPPEDLTLLRPDYGFMARVRDGRHIREYFRKAVISLGLEKSISSMSQSR